jgi:Response regulator of the LytR/AlgR family
MTLRVLIVDDEPAVALYLKTLIEEVPGAEVVAIASGGKEALQKTAIYAPQAVFTDIDMPDMDGLEFARAMRKKREDISLVFATAYPDYALQAFELYSFDYILKPFNEKRIKKTVCKLIEKTQHQTAVPLITDYPITIETTARKIYLSPDHIQYIESNKPRNIVKTLTETYTSKWDMETFEKMLQPYGFDRCHRSYLVNYRLIKEIIRSGRTFQLLLNSGEKILLSRRQEKIFRERMLNQYVIPR